MTKKTLLIIALITLLAAIVLFATGASVLTTEILGIPFGNILLWTGFIALQLVSYLANKGFKKSTSTLGKILRSVTIGLIVVSILWFGIAYILSGNTGFNFSSSATSYFGSPQASILYWNIIYVLVIAPIAISLIYAILRFFERRKAQK